MKGMSPDLTEAGTSKMSDRMTTRVVLFSALCAVLASAIGVFGILGVHRAVASGRSVASDELTTLHATARLQRSIQDVFTVGQTAALLVDPGERAERLTELRTTDVPAAESALAALQRIHADDDQDELASLAALQAQWGTLRDLSTAPTTTGPAAADRVVRAYRPLSRHLAELAFREQADAVATQAGAGVSGRNVIWAIGIATALVILIHVGLAAFGSRKLRRAMEPEHEQAEFANTLQLAEDEYEGYQLLQRHLERSMPSGSVTILNRNNSADRLEAVTAVPADSPLRQTLAGAEPRSCLAVRSGRSHEEDSDRQALLACSVCSTLKGNSACTPLTVGGEVIGSVLVNRPGVYDAAEERRIRQSVGQAAPVLANLRNLAVAEVRAATDSLTGLPNKRAFADTFKRMMAQALRESKPLSLLVLDLDHFKQINDRYGHPIGDQALANVGHALSSAVRDSDFVGRHGGEEFAVLLPNTATEDAVLVGEHIRAVIGEIEIPGVDGLVVSASLGIASYPEHAATTDRLERLADSALYVAKRSGRDRLEVATVSAESGHGADTPPEPGSALHSVGA
jgi:diguanylate cyclase (GGDEF)-like protein